MLDSSSCEVLPIVLKGCETWYFTRKEQNKLKSLKRKEYWKEHLAPKREKNTKLGKNYLMKSFVVLFTKYYWGNYKQ
jgi:hypothetical protein